MNSESQKIKKRPKVIRSGGPRNFICGGCSKTYLSYPALYCHIKRKHNGITPLGTKIYKPPKPESSSNLLCGRPQIPRTDIDMLDENEKCLEIAQNDLMSFLGEKLLVTTDMGPKMPLEDILERILEISRIHTDKWVTDIQEASKIFLTENKEKDCLMGTFDFDNGFTHLDPSQGLKVAVWFMMWLGKLYVKPEFIPDLCLVFSRIWKVLDETQLAAQDLDNKLVWKKILKDCEGLIESLVKFKGDKVILSEFIQKVCHLIGKIFEENGQEL